MSSFLYTKSALYKSATRKSGSASDADSELKGGSLGDAEVETVDTQPSEQLKTIRDSALDIWQCPKCRGGLQLHETTWSCENKHSFDRARQGYTNLLLANKKASNEPGDNREMIDARRGFLLKGFYQPIVESLKSLFLEQYRRVNESIADENSAPSSTLNSEDFSIIDLGCGEGYYLDSIVHSHFTDNSNTQKSDSKTENILPDKIKTFSIDISKIAVQRAAAQTSQKNGDFKDKITASGKSYFAVASSYDIPVFDESIHLALAIFSPVSESELSRILRSNGSFIRVSPGPRHFYQLKEKLYSDITLHNEPECPIGFSLQKQQHLSFEINLRTKEDIENLLAMTPLNWHGNMEAKKQLIEEPVFLTECDFIIQVFEKKNRDTSKSSREYKST